jgi:monoamine oxidase
MPSLLKGGMSTLAEAMFIGRPSQEKLQVQFNAVVTDVRLQRPGNDSDVAHKEDGLIHITCADGSSYTCDAAVVTLPLGVLKQEEIQFYPPLPDWKKSAIERLGYGTYTNVVLVFPKSFWEDSMNLFGVLNRPGENSRGNHFTFWNISLSTGVPTLMSCISGEAALVAQYKTDHDIVKGAMTRLASIFSHKLPLPWPSETLVTRWE